MVARTERVRKTDEETGDMPEDKVEIEIEYGLKPYYFRKLFNQNEIDNMEFAAALNSTCSDCHKKPMPVSQTKGLSNYSNWLSIYKYRCSCHDWRIDLQALECEWVDFNSAHPTLLA